MISQVISLYTSRLLPPRGYFPNSHYSVSEEHCNPLTSARVVFFDFFGFVLFFMSALIVTGINVTLLHRKVLTRCLRVDLVTFSSEQPQQKCQNLTSGCQIMFFDFIHQNESGITPELRSRSSLNGP